MLSITIASNEQWDENKQEFIKPREQKIQLEHSLVSLSKWESKWCKPYLSCEQKTVEETIDYIRCMTVTQNVDPEVYDFIGRNEIKRIVQYIEAPMTATTIKNRPGTKNRDIITAEIIYFWMISLNIPFECQKWHLNRLLTLITVADIKNRPCKKMGRRELLAQNAALNKARRSKHKSRG